MNDTKKTAQTGKHGNLDRRSVLKAALMGGGAVTLTALPGQWTRPVVSSVLLPAHAQTSPSNESDTDESDTRTRNGFNVTSLRVMHEKGSNTNWLARVFDRVMPAAHASIPDIPLGFLCIQRGTDSDWSASYSISGGSSILVGSGDFGDCGNRVTLSECGLGTDSVLLVVTTENSDGSFDFQLFHSSDSDCVDPQATGPTNEPCTLEECSG